MIKTDLMMQKPYKKNTSTMYEVFSDVLFNIMIKHIHQDLKKYEVYDYYLCNEHKHIYTKIFSYSLFGFLLDYLLKSKTPIIFIKKTIEDCLNERYSSFDNKHVRNVFLNSLILIQDILPKYILLVEDGTDTPINYLINYKCKYQKNPVNIKKFIKFCDKIKVDILKEREKDIKKLILGGY